MRHFTIVSLSVWIVLAGILTARAQSLTTIFNFNSTDGDLPLSSLTLGPDGNFYGMTEYGGSHDDGTLFKVTTNGTLTTLVTFNAFNGCFPVARLTLGPDGNLYGTTVGDEDDATTWGTVFKMTTNGTLTTLVTFDRINGANPEAGVTLGPDGNFYGTTSDYGGAIFQVTTNGAFTTLASFNGTNGNNPYADLTLEPDGSFYSTTVEGGGSGNYGVVYQVTTNGTVTALASFNGTNGAYPHAGVTLGPDGNFYGTTFGGGSSSNGTVFQMTTNGTLTALVSFNGTNGANPYGSLALGPDGNFYGTTGNGGSSGYGTVFKVTTTGTLTTLVNFNYTNGRNPYASLTLGPDGNFYGAAQGGGSMGDGTIFRLELPPDFITAPANQTAVIGGSITFHSQVFGTGPFAYQWLSNGVPITGATNATLSFFPVVAGELGSYQLVVTNAYGSLTSQVVSLSLSPPHISAISNGSGGNFVLYLDSQPSSTNRLWATTNVALNQWQVIATNITDSNGLSQFLDTNTAGIPQKFYRLSYP